MTNIFEQLILGSLACFLFLCMSIAGFRIRKDINEILDDIEKLIFYISITQQFFYMLFIYKQLTIFMSAFRVLKLFQVALISENLITMLNEQKSLYWTSSRIFKLICIIIKLGIGWFIVILEGEQFYCDQNAWLVFSIIFFLISICNLYVGSYILSNISRGLKKIKKHQKTNQFTLLRKADLASQWHTVFVIIITEHIVAANMLFWDSQTYYTKKQLFCLEGANITQNFIQLVILIIQYQLSSAALYFVYYRKNRKYFFSRNY